MESKPAGDIRSPLDSVHTNTMAKTIAPNFFEGTCQWNFRGVSADIARIERLKAHNVVMSLKTEGTDYPWWIENMYYDFLLYVTQE